MQRFNVLKFLLKVLPGILLLFLRPAAARAQNGVYFIPTTKQTENERKVLLQTNDDTLKMRAYYYLSSYYTELNKDSAEYFGELQLNMAKKLNQKLWQADALFQIAYITYGLSNYPKSLTAITSGLAITNDENSEKDNWRISLFAPDGDAHRARLFIGAALHQIFAFLYNNVGDAAKANSEFFTATKIAQSVNDQEELSLDYMSLGSQYIAAGKPDSALILENKALKCAIESNYKIYLGTILDIIGDIYFLRKDYPFAGKYYAGAMGASIIQNNLKDEIQAFLSIAKLKRITGQLDSSLFYARRGLATARKFDLPWSKKWAYTSLSTSYKSLNKTDSAYAYLQLENTLGDSLNNVETLKTNQYQSLNLRAQIKQQEAEKASIQAANKTRIYILLAGIAVLLLAAFLLFRNSRQRKKTNYTLQIRNKEIEQQKQKVEHTLTELKTTQRQLIQSEKMASLGELTAGIAHEIQNPLNFVNNFSEVNKEMAEELGDELKSGNIEQALVIAGEIKQNSEKINHHGRRAELIVKGMLEHSRTGTGERQATSINALADEFLKLSYHGLRAKDKDINATITTHFDDRLPQVNVVRQEFGRVLLNLFNNAFYAIKQKQKTAGESYEPEITVVTGMENEKIIIRVTDNGNGIPENIKDKIMQPFFTTKPTGEGTGLGLSLAYDIVVKGHGGSITVNSIYGQGSEFIVSLPRIS